MARNTELLERVMQHIEDHPEQHDQAVWVFKDECGTAACFAGWACLLSGWTVSDYQSPSEPLVSNPTCWYPEEPVSERATKLLGLTNGEAHTLFSVINSRDVLRIIVKDLVNGDQLRDQNEYLDEVSA